MSTNRELTSVEMLEKLVSFPSVSAVSNWDIVNFVKDYLEQHGVTAAILPDETGQKANLYATIGPAVEGGVILSGHTDVVPEGTEDWTSSPWQLTRRNDRLYARGSCDMKGFNALALAAVPDMLKAGLKKPIHIALSYDEEVGCKGAPHLVAAMKTAIATPSAVIVGEPSMMEVFNGHKGSRSFYTRVYGHPSHSSRIDQGISAVMTAARLVTWLDDKLLHNQKTADPQNPFLPNYSTIHCGMIEGGTAPNVVSGFCEFVTDIRGIPEDNPEDFVNAFKAYIEEEIHPRMKAISADARVEVIDRANVKGLRPEQNGYAEQLALELTGQKDVGVVSYGTEAGIFQAAGWSSVVCGPGNIEQAHKKDEYISCDQFKKGEQFIQRLIQKLS